ncbi:hypothetical protein G6F66_015225 [Rhizopus arrhizus]|nr:hypothetical protein G6F66_015225 [Rhizopus arrhizus]
MTAYPRALPQHRRHILSSTSAILSLLVSDPGDDPYSRYAPDGFGPRAPHLPGRCAPVSRLGRHSARTAAPPPLPARRRPVAQPHLRP